MTRPTPKMCKATMVADRMSIFFRLVDTDGKRVEVSRCRVCLICLFSGVYTYPSTAAWD
jgi:hypothetical protein